MRPEAPRALAARELHPLHVTMDGSGDAPAIRFVVAARLVPGGRGIVVLGSEAPFVRVLDASGAALSSFGTPDDGVRAPVAIAVSEGGEVLVAEATGTAVVFGMDGSVHDRIEDSGVLPMAAAAPCPGEWLLYGPRRDAKGTAPAAWLHSVAVGPRGAAFTPRGLQDRSPAGPIGLGRPFGLVSSAGTAVLRHDEGDSPAVVTWRCGEPEPVASARAGPGRRDASAAPREGGGVAVRVPPGMAAPSGIATVDDAVVLADVTFGDDPQTEFTLLRDGREQRLRVSGGYALRDSRSGTGVLLQRIAPSPELFVVSERDFLAMFP
jgi:hypothetical protein